jgi:mono/diheme cytochrome c family protein
MIRWLPLAGTVAALGLCFVQADEPDIGKLPAASKTPVEFVRDVKPLLEGRCAKCHAIDKPKGKFSLRTREDALKSGESAPNIIAGDSAKSKLIHYVGGIVEETVMPPKGQPLTRDEVARLRAWIDQGAKWPADLAIRGQNEPSKHWAFLPPTRPALPAVSDARWPRNAIDHFVNAKQQAAGLKPSAEADKITLIRRLYLDLIGLPPTPREVDEFVADTSAKAYEKIVERLLASPHYGERWGRHWLDAARYADSDGYEKDMSRQIYFFRDWVVNAFNRDLPYDRFITEQIAGDMLPNPTQDQIVATGFLRNSMLNEEGGIDVEQFRMDAMFDRMDAVGKSVLGLTIQCCQCHNHKYDPMAQEEYYRLFAYLNNDHESFPIVYTEEEQKKAVALTRRMRLIEDGLKQQLPDWEKRLAAWEAKSKDDQPEWTVLPVKHVGDHDQHYFYLKDGSVLAQGYAPTVFEERFQGTTDLKEIRAIRLELLTDPNLQSGGPGRSFMGTCALSEFTVEVADAKSPDKRTKVKLVKATADYANPERPLEPNFDDKSGKKRVTGPVEYAIDGKEDTAWGIDAGPGRRNQERKAVFNAAENVAKEGGTIVTVHLVQKHGGWNSDEHMNNNLGRFRISATSKTDAVADPLPRKVRDILAIPRDKRTPAQQAAVFSAWRTSVSEWKEGNAWIEELWKEWPKGDTSLALTRRDEPRQTHMLKRGEFLKPGKQVTAGVPAFLHPLADDKAPGNRLTLAQWLVDRRSPTTARVFVNRMWQHYFGTGLVATPEDFGLQSEKPSHPELLDWLAVEFMESGWGIKHMHRLIVGSATYRQSARVTPELLEKDPLNRLLARAPRLRVDGEIVRDIALSTSGLLNPRVGGPSIFSPAPAFLFLPPASYGPFNWTQALGSDRYRRALYTFRRRSTPFPMLQMFDAPNGDFSCVRRGRSNTPLQALTTLNETVFMDAARALAARVLKEGGKTDDDRLTYAFRLCVSRPPSSDEKGELLNLLEKQLGRVADGSLHPMEVATGKKDGSVPDGLKADQLAAYTIVSRVLLNLDETITKE